MMPVAEKGTATSQLAERAAESRFEDLEADVLDAARRSIADAVTLGLYGAEEPCFAILTNALELSSAKTGASVFGRSERLSMEMAALLNGTAIHAIDYDDTYGAGLAHLTAAVLPAALSVAEARGRTGDEFLAAYIAGYDAAALVAVMSGPSATAQRGFHPTGCFGTYGAAVAAALLLGLDRQGVTRALGLAATQAAGLMANNGTMAKPLQAGKAAANGVLAAMLAAGGFTCGTDPLGAASGISSYSGGADADVLRSLQPVGRALCETTIKPYPSCWLTHGAAEAAIALHSAGAGDAPLNRVVVTVSPYARGVCDRPSPASGLDAKFSLQYVTALALKRGRLKLSDFDSNESAGPRPVPLDAPVEIAGSESLPDNSACVSLYHRDGSMVEHTVTQPTGSPGTPLRRQELAGKMTDVMGMIGAARLVEPLLTAVDALAAAPSVNGLTTFVRVSVDKAENRTACRIRGVK